MPPPPIRKRAPGKFRKPRRKVCMFCVEKATSVDYKSVNKIRKFVSERGKMVPRRTSGNCASHQRLLAMAIKRARHMALIQFVSD
jgi:small subunit ribosomal protein S18